MDENEFHQQLVKLQCRFLCCYPLAAIDWQEIPANISWEQQKHLIDCTYGHPLNKEFPIKIGYQLNFLKRLIQKLEENHLEIHDAVYESYCQVQKSLPQDATTKFAYKHYLLPAYDTHFTLYESKSFVAEGTTGLCSWQSSLALADYLLHKPEIVSDRKIMELGAGTGLCGFILMRCCKVKKMLLTDGSIECIELLRKNIKRNFQLKRKTANGDSCQLNDICDLNTQQLNWNQIESFELLKSFKPNILIAADVVYDDTVFDDLSHAINFIFDFMSNEIKMFLAATVRNEHTLNTFLQILATLQFKVIEKKTIPPERSYLFWEHTTPIKILEIFKEH